MLKYGCDPEVFATIPSGDVISPALLEHFSGLKFLRQDKYSKHPVYIDYPGEFSWMMDGVAFELTMGKPHTNLNEMYETIQNSLDALNNFLSKYTYKGEKLSLTIKPVVPIDPKKYLPYLKNIKVYQGFIFGCDPDEDAILPDYICSTIDVEQHKFRYGGGHIHVSGSDFIKNNILPAVKYMACTVGNFVVANSPCPDAEKMRSTTYGKPGRYRRQKYPSGDIGVEYRTPSNSWLNYNFSYFEKLFHHVDLAVRFLEESKTNIISDYLDKTVESITTANQELARSILESIYNEKI